MPQPLPESQRSLFHRPKLVLEKPKLAAGIGLVAAQWAALEDLLVLMCTFNVFAWDNAGRAATQITTLALSKIDSLAARLSIIEGILADRLPDHLMLKWTQEIAPEIRKRAKERNLVVHGHWHTSPHYPDDIILKKFDDEPMRYTEKDFIDIADRIIATSNLSNNFWFEVRAHLFPKLPPTPPELLPKPRGG